MTKLLHFTIKQTGERLDKLVHAHMGDVSRMYVQDLIKNEYVRVNGKLAKAGEKWKGGELVRVELPDDLTDTTPLSEPELPILFEDDALVVIDKPAGMVVHHGTRHYSGTLVDALLAKYPELASLGDDVDDNEERMGIVHRLDRDTSGVMVVARTMESLRLLGEQFQNHTVDKRYVALLEKTPKELAGTIDAPIGRDIPHKRMAVQDDGKPAKTVYEITDSNFSGGQALADITLLTGRTHQIRVHMAFLGCPLIGDNLYSAHKNRIALNRHFLHARSLAFAHPHTGKRLSFESPMPPELEQLLVELR